MLFSIKNFCSKNSVFSCNVTNYSPITYEKIKNLILFPLTVFNAVALACEIDVFWWRYYFVTPLAHFSKEFLEELERSNAKKPGNAPVALILQSQADYNDISASPASRHILLQIAKTHRVIVKILDTDFFLRRRIKETAEELGRPIDLLCICAHGEKDRLQLGKNSIWNPNPWLSIPNLRPSQFAPLSRRATIILLSCKVGQELAPLLAKCSQRIVLACNVAFSPLQAVFSHAKEPKLLVYGDEGNMLTRAFLPNGCSQILQDDELESSKLFRDKFNYVSEIANRGSSLAQTILGEMYHFGRGGDCLDKETAHKKALYWFRLAADQGSIQAQYSIGFVHLHGRGIAKSDEEALRWFRLAADQGHIEAQYHVALAYLYGRGIAKSDEEALRWFRLAADQGHIEAQYDVALAYLHGRGIAKSDEEALRWFRLAADQGDMNAKCKIGVFYYWGECGLKQSYSDALHWFRLAADQGSRLAQFNLGFMYEHGLGGVISSDGAALQLYRLSADQGFRCAQLLMGQFYEQGRGGLVRSDEDAKRWYGCIKESEFESVYQEIEHLKSQIIRDDLDAKVFPTNGQTPARPPENPETVLC